MSGSPAFTLFPTALGNCGLAWSSHGVVGAQLPEADAARARTRLLRRFPGAVEARADGAAREAIDGIVALLGQGRADFSNVILDMSAIPPFHRRVYEAARAIPAGRTLTYGELAVRIGEPDAARAVGQALGLNPFAPIVPCHRILAAGDGLGGFSARGGVRTKLRLLAIERARRGEEPDLFDEESA